MRHFLRSPPAVSPLTSGVVSCPAKRLLVEPARPPKRLPPTNPSAIAQAVGLSPITSSTDPNLSPAPGAVEKTPALLDDRRSSRRSAAGQQPTIEPCSRSLRWSIASFVDRDDREGPRERHLSGLRFFLGGRRLLPPRTDPEKPAPPPGPRGTPPRAPPGKQDAQNRSETR